MDFSLLRKEQRARRIERKTRKELANPKFIKKSWPIG
jgi:hypothetical protein